MIKPENITQIQRKSPHGSFVFKIKCESCGKEFTRCVVTARSNPFCADCRAEKDKASKYNKDQQMKKEIFQKGYEAGWKDAVKAYIERDDAGE